MRDVEIAVVATDVVRRVVTVSATGDIDLLSATGLQRSVAAVIDAHRPRALVIDVARVEFLDAAGMTALIRLGLANPRVAITLINARPIVTRALEVVGLTALLGAAPRHGSPENGADDDPR